MTSTSAVRRSVRYALYANAAAVSVGGVTTLHAQEAPAPAAAAAPVEEVVVTGSRLQTPNETSISPITSVSAVDIQQTGLTRVEDVLNNLPMVFAGMNSTTSNGADGTASVDLRGLGNKRTLVLVDGLRLGPGAGDGRNYSDINEVPAALIERVDILTGGASAVYGADAVAGVVNFVLNTHFEGVRIDAGYHFNQHNNDDQAGVATFVTQAGDPLPPSSVNTAFGKNASILVGSNFADNKGNATAYITYDNQGAALQSQFDYSACTLVPASATSLACGGSGTSAKNGAGGSFRAYGTGGQLPINYTVDGTNNVFRPFQSPSDEYNYGPLNYYQTPNERWTAGAFVNYDVNSHINVYANVMMMRDTQLAQIAPSGDFGNPSFIPCADPLLNASQKAVICNPANQAAQGNPYEVYNGVNYPGLNMYILRRNVEGGNRVASFQTDNLRQVIGMKGDFGDAQNAWTYNVYGQHSTVDGADSNLNYLSNANIQQSLNVLPGPGGKAVCGGPNNGLGIGPLVTPGTAFSPNSACVPWNIWQSKGVTPAALNYLSIPEQSQDNVQEYIVDGSVTGDLGKYGVKLPTADQGLQMNLGVEWRQDASTFNPDYVSQQGLAAGGGGATLPVSGTINVREVFTELRLPLATHQFLAEDLSVEGGYRYSSYNLGFDTNTYKLGLEWSPIRDVRLRGSYERAVRAPNIAELYSPNTVGLDGSVDPCSGSTPTASLAACEKSGVTPAQYGHISPNPANQYNGLLGGNPNLQPEKADTYTVGIQLTPSFVPNLSISVDYFNIDIKNVIEALGGNTILLECVATGQLCNNVFRAPTTGSLWLSPLGYVKDTVVNEGELKTSGVDVKGTYRQPLPAVGSLLFSLEGTYLKDLQTSPVPGGVLGSYDCKGFFGATCGAGNPSWRSVFNVTWSTPWDALDLNVRWRYYGSTVSEQYSSSPYLAGTPYVPLGHIPAYSYFDLTATFNVYKTIRLELGVNNVADKVPPMVVGSDCSTSSGGGNSGANCNGNTFPGYYDAMGRYLFAHLSAQF
jgi:iron complex outermembrane receptor protein